jgi:MoxR-like ATPase
MSNAVNATVDIADVRRRFLANERALCSFVYERQDLIRMANVAALTREHTLWVGPPGTAKSLLARLLASQFCDDNPATVVYREFLFSRQATESDVLAHKDVPAFMAGQDQYVLTGHITEACFAFADEIFKASGSTLNGCLSWLNERTVKGHAVPLVTCFAASNEFGEDDSLKALRDRFAISHVVGYMRDRATRIAYAKDRAAGRQPPALEPIQLRELEHAQRYVAGLDIDEAVFEACADLQVNLEGVGVSVSDRTVGKSFNILRAFAWLDGSSSVGLEHVECLRHVLWNDPAEIPSVEAALGGINKGIVGEIRAIVEEALRPYYQARSEYVNGAWTSERAREEYERQCPALMERCMEASKVIKSKFGGQVPARVRARAKEYMEELRAAHDTCKHDSKIVL